MVFIDDIKQDAIDLLRKSYERANMIHDSDPVLGTDFEVSLCSLQDFIEELEGIESQINQ